jgi:hypothetical protein
MRILLERFIFLALGSHGLRWDNTVCQKPQWSATWFMYFLRSSLSPPPPAGSCEGVFGTFPPADTFHGYNGYMAPFPRVSIQDVSVSQIAGMTPLALCFRASATGGSLSACYANAQSRCPFKSWDCRQPGATARGFTLLHIANWSIISDLSETPPTCNQIENDPRMEISSRKKHFQGIANTKSAFTSATAFPQTPTPATNLRVASRWLTLPRPSHRTE